MGWLFIDGGSAFPSSRTTLNRTQHQTETMNLKMAFVVLGSHLLIAQSKWSSTDLKCVFTTGNVYLCDISLSIHKSD